MTRKELRQRVERLLQDSDNKRWSDTEINGYIDDAQLEFCRLSKVPKTTVSQNLVDVSTRRTSASLVLSGKTVTVTLNTGDVHTLAADDAVLITGSTSSSRNGGHIVTSVPSNTTSTSNFTYVLPSTESGSETGIIVMETGPVYTKPTSIMEMTSVSIDGRELAIYTESELNGAANRHVSTSTYLNTSLGLTPAPFFNLPSYYEATKWRDVEGRIEAVVFNEKSASSFRVFPLPSDDEHLYVDKDASSKVSQEMLVHGVQRPTALSADTSTPIIPDSFQESLVFGSLERAYMKESQLRNVEKSGFYRSKFNEYVVEAMRNESMSSGSISTGRNQMSHRVWR